MAGAGPDDLWCVGDDRNVVYHYASGGWTTHPFGADDWLEAVTIGPGGEVWLAGTDLLLRSRDGKTFERIPVDMAVRDLAFSGGVLWLAGSDGATGVLAKWTDTNWEIVVSPRYSTYDLNRVIADRRGGVWAVGDGGTVVHAGGAEAEFYDSGTSADLHGVAVSASGQLFAVGDDGVVLKRDADN